MASAKEKFLKKLSESLPDDLCKPKDVASLGLFGNAGTLATDRRLGRGLPFVSVSKNRTRYPKEDVLQYAAEHFHELDGKK